MTTPRSLFDKLWDSHVVDLAGKAAVGRDGLSLIWIDRHFVHEGSHHAFAQIAGRGSKAARPDLTFGVADHYVPVRGDRHAPASPDIARMIRQLSDNTAKNGIRLFGVDDPRQGIVHVIGPEQGLTLPGLSIVCGDSHTATHGAFGAYAFGIGASEVAHVLATQTLWQRKPKQMRITVDGALAPGVAAKDVILSIIAKIGADGAVGHAIEYAGSTIRGLSMEGRMTLCNMSIEGGGRCGMVAPDETTYRWLRGRPAAPAGDDFDRAVEQWSRLPSDADAAFDSEVSLSGAEIAPVVTWGNSLEDTLPITARVPDPGTVADAGKARAITDAIDYMGLTAGRPLDGIPIDRVFIGSCTNARIEDLRAAAAVLSGRRAKVPGLVAPGSMQVKRQAEEEGLDRIFSDAGLEWAASGCSMCVAMNGDAVPAGERCASTTNRNFRGRQGPGSRTHLMSPAMVAAAAVAGCLTDVRPLLKGRVVLERPLMQPFTPVASVAVPLDVANIDTDQLIPARFMSRPRSQGYGDFLLHDVRRDGAGAPKVDFPLNDPAYAKAAIIVAARNFGTGSSREAAVYALWDAGIRTVIAPSFGDIFASNAVKNGLLPARVSPEDQARLIADLAADPGIVVTVHLAQQEILWRDETIGFDIAEGAKQQLLNGWDDIDMTMQHGASIEAWSTADKARRPWAVPRLSATP